ncbi:MAG: OstA-like protein [Flavobacteriales bacterium]
MKFKESANRGFCIALICAFWAFSPCAVQAIELCSDTVASGPGRVKILKAEAILKDMVQPEVQRLVGGVELQYEDVFLNCDSAWRYDDGRFTTMGHVLMRDGMNTMEAEFMEMNPKNQQVVARSTENDSVVMKGDMGNANAPLMRYQMDQKRVILDKGGKLIDENTQVRFDHGGFDLKTSVMMLGGNVSIESDSQTIVSDSIHLLHATGGLVFHGPSRLWSTDGSLELYCTEGVFDNATASGWFAGMPNASLARVRQKDTWLEADSLVLPPDSLAPREAWGHVSLSDTLAKWTLSGAHAIQFLVTDGVGNEESWMIGSDDHRAQYRDVSASDTLWLEADTLALAAQSMRAWPEVWMEQGSAAVYCDTLIWNEADSVMEFIQAPQMWLEGQYLRSDSMTMMMKDGRASSLHAWGHAGLLNPAGDSCYQQIAGRDFVGQFGDGQLRNLLVSGNAELVYFDENETEQTCEEFNRAACSRLRIALDEGQVSTITLLDAPTGAWTAVGSSEYSPWIDGLKWESPPTHLRNPR